MMVSADGTNTYIVTHVSQPPFIINKSTMVAAQITAANWKVVVTPILLH